MFPRKNKLDRLQAKKSKNRDKKRYYSHLKTLDKTLEETTKQVNNISLTTSRNYFQTTLNKIIENKRNSIQESNKNDLKQLEKETEHLRIAATWVSKIKNDTNYKIELEQIHNALNENKLNGELTKATIELENKIKQTQDR